jgi:hypothetical protein
MIISDEHRLAFIHIPKCAGVSVKQPLRTIDSTHGNFSRIGDHPVLGRIHYAHILLRDLADHFPEEWTKLRDYRSFAVVRDPTERFTSAMFQRLREFKGLNQSDITPQRFEAEADEVMRHLENTPERLGLEYVHFNRQTDFLFLDGKRIVETLFPIENMAAITAYIARETGVAVQEERKNRSTEIRLGSLKPVARLLRRPYAALVPYAARNKLRQKMVNAGLYTDAKRRPLVRAGSSIEGFIRSYYAEDLKIHAACR